MADKYEPYEISIDVYRKGDRVDWQHLDDPDIDNVVQQAKRWLDGLAADNRG